MSQQCETTGHTYSTTGERICVYCGALAESPRAIDLDQLRALCATPGRTDDECVIDLYAWWDARMQADAWMDDTDGLEETLYEWYKNGLKPPTVADVKVWLHDLQHEDAMNTPESEVRELVSEWRVATQEKSQ